MQTVTRVPWEVDADSTGSGVSRRTSQAWTRRTFSQWTEDQGPAWLQHHKSPREQDSKGRLLTLGFSSIMETGGLESALVGFRKVNTVSFKPCVLGINSLQKSHHLGYI